MNIQYTKIHSGLCTFDPRTKILLLAITVFAATMAPSLRHVWLLVLFITLFGCTCGKAKRPLCHLIFFALFYLLTLYVLSLETGVVYTMFVAWMGLFYKVYPCAMLAGIILSTTSVNEFLTAMNKAHVSKRIYIPLAVMLRYIPTIQEDWHYIKDGMRLRDVPLSFKGFIHHPGMTIECLYVPLLMTASKAADELAIASVTRGIENPHSRTCLIQIKFRIQDILVIICFLFLLALNAGEIGGAV